MLPTDKISPEGAVFMAAFFFMARSINESFYKQSKWRRCRDAYISSHPLCERCHEQGLIVPSVYVHHIQHLTPATVKIPALAYGSDNLQALCFDCHEEIHGRKKKRRYKVDDTGKILPP